MHRERRSFVRHPTALPVALSLIASDRAGRATARDVGQGGLCLRVTDALPVGAGVSVTMPVLGHAWRFEARVAWVARRDDGWDVGLCFERGDERARARLVEQICQIEAFRAVELARGREVTSEQAAVEWSRDHAASFPEF